MSEILSDRRQLLTSLGIASATQALYGDSRSLGNQGTLQTQRQIESFGARGDGETDDSAAFERALASALPGEVIGLSGGRSYRLTRSLVFTRPLVIAGGTKEHTRLLFDDGKYAQLGGIAAAIILPHDRGRGMTSGVTARRTALSGFTVAWVGTKSSRVNGLLIATPTYLDSVDVLSFPGDGFRVEAESNNIGGNANGCSFINCSAQGNEGNGFVFYGNDANACLLLASRAFDNHEAGFYDGSLLGNTYVGAEVDGNSGAGFASTKVAPNRSIYIGCYAEPNQRYDLNDRNMVLGALGHATGSPAAMLRALPSGELFSRTAQVFAATEGIAADLAHSTGSYLRLGCEGLDFRADDGHRLRVAKLLSPNYVDILNGDNPLIRFPSRDVVGNVTSQRPWLPSGMVVGAEGRSGIVGAGPAPPTSGIFEAGALWLNDNPAPNKFVGWVCVSPGQPGRWLPFARITDND